MPNQNREKNVANVNFKNLAKIANVEVKMTVKLGGTSVSLQDAIEYDNGSIIMLDNKQNEPVGVYVDDILIAKGMIVAIDNSYGIKITELTGNSEDTQKEKIENK